MALKGLWEVCRHDEQMPGEVAAPIKDFPEKPYWQGHPCSRRQEHVAAGPDVRPSPVVSHQGQVPDGCAGKSFYLVFPQNNLNTTVYVNGVYCGFDKNPFARVQIDMSKADQARRQRNLGRHPRRLVRPHLQSEEIL